MDETLKMNIETGEIRKMDSEDFKAMSPQERSKYVEVKRDLTQHEHANMQIKLYSPCGCGSGNKFKFCCYRKPN